MNPTTNTEEGADVPCEYCGHVASYHVREALQRPYRPLWQAIIERISNLSPDMPIYKRDLDRWAVELWNDVPEAKKIISVRTTEYGGDPRHG